MCESAYARYADSPALTQGDRSLSFTELEVLSRSIGAWLQNIGVAKGDRIALMLPNILEFPIALFGAPACRMTVVNLNPMYTPSEVQQILDDSQPLVLVTLASLCSVIEACGSRNSLRYIITVNGEGAQPASTRNRLRGANAAMFSGRKRFEQHRRRC